jgi:hypothetical protein
MISIHIWRPTYPGPRFEWYRYEGERGFVIRGVIAVTIEVQ